PVDPALFDEKCAYQHNANCNQNPQHREDNRSDTQKHQAMTADSAIYLDLGSPMYNHDQSSLGTESLQYLDHPIAGFDEYRPPNQTIPLRGHISYLRWKRYPYQDATLPPNCQSVSIGSLTAQP